MNERKCEICGRTDFARLHGQDFYIDDEVDILSYSVVACNKCGFVFASNVPSQDQYESYYNENKKYTYDEGVIPGDLKKLHQDAFFLIDSYLKNNDSGDHKETAIIDIGCSTGNLLSVFKDNGYRDLTGLELSQACCEIANGEHGLNVEPTSLRHYESSDRYDLAMLTGVVEHINDLSENLERVCAILKEKGQLFVIVPDATNFSLDPKEPFHEFSIEHINYFTHKSLSNLLCKYGFANTVLESVGVELYDSHVLMSLWTKSEGIENIEKDINGARKVKEYILRSNQKQRAINALINDLVKSGEEVIVWGVGSLTSRLLISSDLGRANIVKYVDSDKGHHGKRIKGVDVVSPQILKGKEQTVLVSSSVYGKEIKDILVRDLDYKGRVVLVGQQ